MANSAIGEPSGGWEEQCQHHKSHEGPSHLLLVPLSTSNENRNGEQHGHSRNHKGHEEAIGLRDRPQPVYRDDRQQPKREGRPNVDAPVEVVEV